MLYLNTQENYNETNRVYSLFLDKLLFISAQPLERFIQNLDKTPYEESLQLRHLFRPDSTNKGKGHDLFFNGSLNSQRHRFVLETTIMRYFIATGMPIVSH
jgi:hypothetical protein